MCLYKRHTSARASVGTGACGICWRVNVYHARRTDTRCKECLCIAKFPTIFQQTGKTRQYRTRCLSRKSLVPQGFAGMKRNEWVPGKTDVIFLVRMRSAVQIRPAAPRKALSLNGFKAFLLQKRMKKAGF